jgi:asparagine synthase (glutamine-hydrolysing)
MWAAHARPRDELEAGCIRMRDALAHRGPDGRGVWSDPEAGIALGHRRLAILDLTEDGAQPMRSASGRYVVAFNGEIYNFAELRAELKSRRPDLVIRGGSDTAVMLAAFEAWGVDAAVERFIGMFAFALWDAHRRTLSLARDRLGIKPLYVGRTGDGSLVFGSELSALAASPDFPRHADRSAIQAFLQLGCVPAPLTGFAAARKLRPGTIVEFSAPALDAGRERVYWSALSVMERGAADRFAGSEEDAADELEALLRDAVRLRLVADVPVGAFLSGGVDSTTVVSFMRELSPSVRTFTIANEVESHDEEREASAVARHLDTHHEVLRVTERDALEAVRAVPSLLDEPFGDSSIIPTYLVSRLARRRVTVALSGDGGDELFGGYHRHAWMRPVWTASRAMPVALRRSLASAGSRLRGTVVDRWIGPVMRARTRIPSVHLEKAARLVGSDSWTAAYLALRTHWPGQVPNIAGASERDLLGPAAWPRPGGVSDTEAAMYWDLVSYLPDDILTKVDRASMAVALEARVPLLDHRIVAFVARLPLHHKLRGLTGKRVLRRVLARRVPPRLLTATKSGFGVPMGRWMRGPLEDFVRACLSPERVRSAGFVDSRLPEELLREHTELGTDRHDALWDLVCLHEWARRFGVN